MDRDASVSGPSLATVLEMVVKVVVVEAIVVISCVTTVTWHICSCALPLIGHKDVGVTDVVAGRRSGSGGMSASCGVWIYKKNENKNEPENDHFCKSERRVRFSKNVHFWTILDLIFKFIFEKWDSKWDQNEPKMAQKWLLWTTLLYVLIYAMWRLTFFGCQLWRLRCWRWLPTNW